MFPKVFFLVALLIVCFAKKTLVILDNDQIQQSHSQFFQMLKTRGHELTFQTRGKKVILQQFGEYQYDNLIIFSPKADGMSYTSSHDIGELSPRMITDFVDSNHNVLVAADNVLSEHLREVASQSGIEFDDDNTRVFDFFNKNENSAISTNNCHKKVSICKKAITYKGLAMSLDENNELLLPILTGSKTSYSYQNEPLSDKPFVMGRKTVLISGVQGRNGARLTFSGSLDMFSNKMMTSNTENKIFAENVTKWSFGEKGILRLRNVIHNKVGTTEIPSLYTVSEELEYQVTLEELLDGVWTPFVATDVQLELIMLDPYIRITLQHIKDGRYYTKFRVPDVYGVFKFVINYKKQGYSHLIYSDEIVIRPLRINQFERFIPSAYPYYAALFSLMVGFFVFGLAFLYTAEKEHKE